MTDDEKIEQIIKSFKVYALGDIKHNSNRAISGFILCSCFIDQLSGFVYNSSTVKSRFQRFAKEYLGKRYDPVTLYETLRNGLIHSYSLDKKYALTTDNDPDLIGELSVLQLQSFIYDLEIAFEKICEEFRIKGQKRINALTWFKDHEIINEKVYLPMEYTQQEAEVLISYYWPKMKDGYLDDSKELRVESIVKSPSKNGLYWVKVNAKLITDIRLFREIGLAAIHFKLDSPTTVLKHSS